MTSQCRAGRQSAFRPVRRRSRTSDSDLAGSSVPRAVRTCRTAGSALPREPSSCLWCVLGPCGGRGKDCAHLRVATHRCRGVREAPESRFSRVAALQHRANFAARTRVGGHMSSTARPGKAVEAIDVSIDIGGRAVHAIVTKEALEHLCHQSIVGAEAMLKTFDSYRIAIEDSHRAATCCGRQGTCCRPRPLLASGQGAGKPPRQLPSQRATWLHMRRLGSTA